MPGRKSGQKGKIMDCSKTIDFFSEFNRLCNSRSACEADAANKEQCPVFEVCDHPLTEICVEDAIKAVVVMSANDVARVLAENLKGGKEGNLT